MASPPAKKSVLFICLGNICRSPIAEAIFRDLVTKRGVAQKWHIDSAAIGDYHIGKGPDDRAVKCMGKHGITSDHKVRMVKKADFTKFDIIFGMDDENMGDLDSLKPDNSTAEVKLLGPYDPKNIRIIEDPYYPGVYEDFETVFEQCTRCCQAFLDSNPSSYARA